MTQPRKEQINDQRTYYTNLLEIGVATPIPFGTPDVAGGTVQTIQNTLSENYYTEFLASTITKAPGGAEADTPAYFYGNSGPFTSPIVPGSSFSITLPNINSGNPVVVTFQAGDVVNISSTPVITTSKAVARINIVLTVAGVNPNSPVAQNVNGQLVLVSAGPSGYTFGEDAFITVNDVSVGVCSALGFTASNTATSTGISSPQHGIVTTLMQSTGIGPQVGGYVPLQLPDATPAITQSNVQINIAPFGNLPLYPPGQAIFGLIQQFTDTSAVSKFTISYFRKGAVPARIITSGSNCASILNTDTFTVTVSTVNPFYFPGGVAVTPPDLDVQSYTFTVTFGSSPTGPQDVINAVNTAWNGVATTLGLPFAAAGSGGVFALVPGPWSFVDFQDSFWIILNGQPAIKIAPTTGVYSAADLATFINAAISTAGQGAQGVATVTAPSILSISSLTTTGPASTVQIVAGDPIGTQALPTNSDTRMLDKLGLSPGIYSGSVIAKLYGNDEIQFVCPDHTIADPHGTPSGITVAGTAPVLAKLGLTGTSVTVTTTTGIEPVSPPVCNALIPEMMYFGEVPENIQTTEQQFAATDELNPISPGTGTGNLGASPLLGLDGKVNPGLLHKILESLNVNSLTLGSKNLNSNEGSATPRLVTPFATTGGGIGLTLMWEGVSTAGVTGSGASQLMRMFVDGAGGIWVTTNANQPASPSSPFHWVKDVEAQSASAIYIGQATTSGLPKLEFLYAPTSAASPFVFAGEPGTGNIPPLGFDPTGALGGALAFILAGTQSTTSGENLIPRFAAQAALGTFTLIWQATSAAGTAALRIYAYEATPVESHHWLTLNAEWNGTTWQKDQTGHAANAVQLLAGGGFGSVLNYWHRAGSDDTPWAQWVANGPASAPNSILPFSVSGLNGNAGILQANNVRLGELAPAVLASEISARISIPVHPDAGVRICVAEFGTGPQGSDFLAGQGGNGGATFASTGGGNATITGLNGMTSNMQGMYLYFTGAASSANNGHFQIVSFVSGSSVVVANPSAVAPDANNGHITWALGGAGQGVTTRIYQGTGLGIMADFTAITCNAKWNGSHWVPDVAGVNATMQLWSSTNFAGVGSTGCQFYYRSLPAGNWVDGGWSTIASIGNTGIFIPTNTDPHNTQGVGNLISSSSQTKVWGNFDIFNSGGGPVLNDFESYGVASLGTYNLLGVTLPLVNFYGSMADTNYSVTSNVNGPGFTAIIPGTTSMAIAVYTQGGSAIDFGTSPTFAQVNFAVHGYQ